MQIVTIIISVCNWCLVKDRHKKTSNYAGFFKGEVLFIPAVSPGNPFFQQVLPTALASRVSRPWCLMHTW